MFRLKIANNRVINIDKLIHEKEHKKRDKDVKDLKIGLYNIKKLES